MNTHTNTHAHTHTHNTHYFHSGFLVNLVVLDIKHNICNTCSIAFFMLIKHTRTLSHTHTHTHTHTYIYIYICREREREKETIASQRERNRETDRQTDRFVYETWLRQRHYCTTTVTATQSDRQTDGQAKTELLNPQGRMDYLKIFLTYFDENLQSDCRMSDKTCPQSDC